MITTFLSYVIKLFFALLSSYAIIYLLHPDNSNEKDALYKDFSLLTLNIASLIGVFYIYYLYSDSIFFFIFSIALAFIYIFIISDKGKSDFKNLYLLNFISIISIFLGYFLYSLVTILVYYFLMKNYTMFINGDDSKEDLLDEEV